jgi:hypothetical protein
VGILSATWFIPRSKLPALPDHLQVLLDEYEFTMPAMPAFDLSAEWTRFKSNIPEPWKLANDGREFLVGEELKSRGLEAKYPVVLIPGIISTARFSSLCHRSECSALCRFLGSGILVNISGIQRILPTEGLGWLLHGFTSHV